MEDTQNQIKETNELIPRSEPWYVKNTFIITVAIALVVFIVATAAGAIALLKSNEDKNHSNNNVTPTATMTPTVVMNVLKTLTLTSAPGVAPTTIDITIPNNAKIEEYKNSSLDEDRFSIAYPKYQIIGENNEYILVIGKYYESSPQKYFELTDLKTKEYFSSLYRAKSSSTSTTWGYTTNVISDQSCKAILDYSPCGNVGIIKEGDDANSMDVLCKTTTQKGLESCDIITKSIRTK